MREKTFYRKGKERDWEETSTGKHMKTKTKSETGRRSPEALRAPAAPAASGRLAAHSCPKAVGLGSVTLEDTQ